MVAADGNAAEKLCGSQDKTGENLQVNDKNNSQKDNSNGELNNLEVESVKQITDGASGSSARSTTESNVDDAQLASTTSQAASCLKFKIPDYPLFPLSKGFVSSLKRCIENLRLAFEKQNLFDSSSAGATDDKAATR